MQATKAAKAIDGNTNALEVRKLDASVITYHNVFNVAAAINKRTDLSPCFMGQLSELPRKFRRQNLVRSNSPGVELFDAAKLIGLETRGVS